MSTGDDMVLGESNTAQGETSINAVADLGYTVYLSNDTGGGLLVQATEWGTREQVLHSYELIGRYVKPHFQGSLTNLCSSAMWSSAKKDEIMDLRAQAIEKAKRAYLTRSGSA